MIFMNITIVGTGYVGLVTGACLAELGNNVTCIDIDKSKVDMLNKAKAPIFEKGLENLLKNHAGKKLNATNQLPQTAEVIFICVGTPSREDGSTDLKYIENAARDIGKKLKSKKDYCVVVVKSTVPPKTTESLIHILEKESGKKCGKDFGIAMNPEFLREGNAVYDFMNPDRIIIGANDDKSYEKVYGLYKNFKCPILSTDLRTAEMIKYTSNAFLATKISFSNEIGNICKALNIDVYDVMNAIGIDKRIGRAFLNAGIGYGGSCFPKDVKSLISTAKNVDVSPKILNAVIGVNENQPLKIVELAKKKLGTLKDKKITILGLAFKPDSDDMREAPSIKVINELLASSCKLAAYDPIANENAKKIFGDKIEYASSLKGALAFSDIIFILTEWEEFNDEKLYKDKIVFDGRYVLKKKSDKNYEGVCW